ncbi:MAG: deoxyribonuclease IV [Candidatus Heimdallarchaeaceae archaeon]
MTHFWLGCHVSITGSVDRSFEHAKKRGCNTFQIFTKNPRSWRAKEFSDVEIKDFREKKTAFLSPIVGHISYLPNLASQKVEIYQKSLASFFLEIRRSLLLNLDYLVIHCGSYKGGTFRSGLNNFVSAVLQGLVLIDEQKANLKILIENTVGSKNSLGGKLEDISKILTEVGHSDKVQMCFDTCHAFSAGYDLRTKQAIECTLQELDSKIGIENVPVIHLNDSKASLSSHIDRHEHIGLGQIGVEGMSFLLNNPKLEEKIWILETPINEIRNDYDNIAFVKGLRNNK